MASETETLYEYGVRWDGVNGLEHHDRVERTKDLDQAKRWVASERRVTNSTWLPGTVVRRPLPPTWEEVTGDE